MSASRLLAGEQAALIPDMVASGDGRLGVRVERRVLGLAGGDQALDALSVRHVLRVAAAEAWIRIDVYPEPGRTSFVAGQIRRSASCHEMAFNWNRLPGLNRKRTAVNPVVPWHLRVPLSRLYESPVFLSGLLFLCFGCNTLA